MRLDRSYRPALVATASLAALAALSWSTAASAQQYPIYSENFNSGYTVNTATLSDQNNWTTNDEDTNNTYLYNTSQLGSIGQSDNVGTSGLSMNSSDYVGSLGGVYGQAVAPGNGAGTGSNQGTVTLNHAVATNGATSVVFGTDFQITQPSTALPKHDTFGFALTGTSGSLISVNFAPDTANDLNFDNVTYTAATTSGAKTGFGINLGTNTRYRLIVSVNVTAGTFGATIQGETSGGLLTGTIAQVVPTGTAYVGGSVTGYAATWALQDYMTTTTSNNIAANPTGTNVIAHSDAGSNALYFDNVLVTVPEPSTYAMIGLGALGLAMMVRRSLRARAA